MSRLDERLKTLLRPLDYSEAERNQLIRLMLLLANLQAPPDAERSFPKYATDKGRAFYTKLAHTLDESRTEVVVFSIADCLRDFLPPRFEMFYTDGHLTCFRGPAAT